MKYFIKSRVGAFPGYTLKQLLEEANKRTGYKMYQGEFTKALQGKDDSPRADKILAVSDEILLEMEGKK